ncbi:MAG TPA: bifunctional GNAT family N-acetyltransferase/acetate--CoA ligase family protein [Nocardioidaceae bacterium]|nr:bifunctional GNAT family N-acetyltransferase/acetate--CoA ligase family protein [Nocardioidaceae bacterium]
MSAVTADSDQPSAGYPATWEADVVLRDGRAAQLRPIRPEDAQRFIDFYSRVSDRSKYFRFFAPYPTLSDRDVQHFTSVDHHERVALVVTLGDDIIGVGRFDRIDDEQAEVAFLIEDAHQGRGLAQLLLEHLAEAARERGYSKFEAEVLPDNVRMIKVFREQGYRVAGGITDGVMRLEFPIRPTDTSIGVVQAREHRAESASMKRLFDVHSVAVVGASRRQDTIGRTLVRNLVLGDFTGVVYAVNPQSEAISGLPAYASVQDIPGEVDLAIVAVPADAVADVVLDCAAKGVHGLVVISSGFAETGREGRERQRRLLALARSYGLRLVGPNCLGVINTASDVRINASLSPLMPPTGRVGFFCQSGALGVAILENVDRRGLGLSTFVSAGNRADVSGNDLLQYWEEDDATDVVLLYLESIGNPRKFSRIARRVSRHKPIVAVKSGRTTQGVPVGHAVRHTSAPQAAVDSMFEQAGVIQVDTLDEMFDVAQLLAYQPLPRGRRVAVVGNSDALGLLAADTASAVGLVVREPVALGSDASAEDFERALDDAIDDPGVDAVVAVYIPPLESTGADVALVLATVGEQSDKPIVSTFLGREGVPEMLRVRDVEGVPGRGSVPSYPAPNTAVRALAKVVEYTQWLAGSGGDVPAFEEIDTPTARRVVEGTLVTSPSGADLSPAQVRDVLGAYGIDLWDQVDVDSVSSAVAAGEQLGWDVVLKAHAEHLRTRPDMYYVWRNIDGAEEMRQAWQELTRGLADPREGRFVVQRQADPGVPVTIEGLEDPLFGPLVSFGLSGAPSELLHDRAWRIPPMTDTDAAAMVREVRSSPLLMGYRGAEPVDLSALEDLVQRIARLKNDLPHLAWIELALVLVNASGASVLDASARVAPTGASRTDVLARRLARMPGDTVPG